MTGRRRRDWFRFCNVWKRIGRAYLRSKLGAARARELQLADQHKLIPGHPVERVISEGPFRGLQILGAPADWEPLPGTPRTRGDCPDDRPCRFVRCKHNLQWVDTADRPGTRRPTHRLPLPLIVYREQSCVLDFCDANPDGGRTHDEIGRALGITGERVMQNLDVAFAKISASGFDARGWADALAHERVSRGRKTK